MQFLSTRAPQESLTPATHFPKHLAEDGVHVAELAFHRKSAVNLMRHKVTTDVGVFVDKGPKVFSGFPHLHRVALHPAVGFFAGSAFGRKIEQKLAGKD